MVKCIICDAEISEERMNDPAWDKATCSEGCEDMWWDYYEDWDDLDEYDEEDNP